jgi:hypothetical protein
MIGIDIAIYLANEPREKKVAFMKHICETKTDHDVKEMNDSKNKLFKAFEEFSQTKLEI